MAATALLAASAGHEGHGDRVVVAVVTVASVAGVDHGSAASESVPLASMGSKKETAPGAWRVESGE